MKVLSVFRDILLQSTSKYSLVLHVFFVLFIVINLNNDESGPR
jgi:hypothetical protein